MYAYQADLWCDDCGRLIKEDCDRAEQEDTGDTDDYPQYRDEDYSATDCPYHCANVEDCRNAIQLEDGRKVGMLIEEQLTTEGRRYVLERHEHNPSEITRLWLSTFGITPPDNEGEEE